MIQKEFSSPNSLLKNVDLLPIFVFHGSSARRSYYYRVSKKVEDITYVRDLTLKYSGVLGCPGEFDQDIWIIMQSMIINKINEEGDCNALKFTVEEINKILEIKNAKEAHKKIKESITRLTDVNIEISLQRYDDKKGDKNFSVSNFNIFDMACFKDKYENKKYSESHVIYPSSWLINLFIHKDASIPNTAFYFSLRHVLTKRLYRYLLARFLKSKYFASSMKELANEIPLDKTYLESPNKLKGHLSELKEKHFLKDFSVYKESGHWYLKANYDEKFEEYYPPRTIGADLEKIDLIRDKYIALFEKSDLGPKAIRELLRYKSVSEILMYVEKVGRSKPSNPAGMLFAAVKNDWTLREIKKEKKEDMLAEKRKKNLKKMKEDKEKWAEQKREEDKMKKIYEGLSDKKKEGYKEKATKQIREENSELSEEVVKDFFLKEHFIRVKIHEMLKKDLCLTNGVNVSQ